MRGAVSVVAVRALSDVLLESDGSCDGSEGHVIETECLTLFADGDLFPALDCAVAVGGICLKCLI